MKELNIGEIFEYNGEWYQCVEDSLNRCADCCFFNGGHKECSDELGECSKGCRSDETSVIFKKLEKIEEPPCKSCYFGMVQLYKLPYWNNGMIEPIGYHFTGDGYVLIEIKQDNEDMGEKKQCGDNRFMAIARAKEHLFQTTNIAEDKKELKVLDSFLLRCWQMGWLKQYEDAEEKKLNLKPFDIQKAREGKPVCTRDGRRARILCFDMNSFNNHIIVALITEENGTESIYSYTSEGKWKETETENDLMMLPEKKDGWVNVYKDSVYDTKDEALIRRSRSESRGYIDTIKISWEE